MMKNKLSENKHREPGKLRTGVDPIENITSEFYG